MKSKDFKKYFSSALDIVKLNPKEIIKVAKDKDATLWGLIFVVVAGLATAIGALITNGIKMPILYRTTLGMPKFSDIVVMPIGYLLWTFIFIGILWVLAKLFGGKARFVEHYRAQSLGLVVYWIGVIPIIGPMILWIAELWYLVMSVFIIKNVHKLKTWQAVLVVLIPIIVIVILIAIFIAALVTWFVAMGITTPEELEQLKQLATMT